jgi:hypothetical protein
MPATFLESSAGRLAQRAGSTISRRSFFGKTAKYAAVMVVSAAGVNLRQSPAFAALACDCAHGNCDSQCPPSTRGCSCCPSNSVSCNGLCGQSGACCPNTVACGHWFCGCQGCGSGIKQWTDCCASANQCNDVSSCHCVNDTDGVNRPTCCNKKCWAGGSASCAYIVCRKGGCT